MTRMLVCLAAAFLFAADAHAQKLDAADYDYENLAFRGVGFDYSHIWPNKVEPASVFGARVDLGYLGPGVRIVPGVSYWSSQFKESELRAFANRLNRLPALRNNNVTMTAADLGTIDWTDFSIALDAQYVWTTPANVLTYVGLGGVAHALNGSGTAIDDTFVEDLLDSFSAGAAAMAGIEYEVIPRLRVYAEGRFNFLGDVQYPGVKIGAAFMLPGGTPGDRAVKGKP